MSTTQTAAAPQGTPASPQKIDMKLEVIVIPVADIERAKAFYTRLGWRLDIDLATTEDFRVVHFTPPGSTCSILFGKGLTNEKPGSVQGLHLTVSDVVAAQADLVARGIDVSEVFHDAGGVFHHAGTEARVSGPQPERRSYGSFASFTDPDGNGWAFQEITTRLPGRIDASGAQFSSTTDLAGALRRAAAAHGEHEKVTGKHDDDWPDWYAAHLVAEQAGTSLPK